MITKGSPVSSFLSRVTRNASHDEVDAFIRRQLGPQYLPLNIVIPMILIYVAIFITGVLGNIAVCHVIAKNPSMHSTTNYYLFSLAVSDLSLLLLGVPYDISLYIRQYPWPLSQSLCKLRALVSEMASYTSVLTIVALSVERYFAICHPLYAYSVSGFSRAIKIIGFTWLISSIAAYPFAHYTKINYLEYPEGSGIFLSETAFCALFIENLPDTLPIYELSFLLFFVCPMVSITLLLSFIRKEMNLRIAGIESVDGTIHDPRLDKSRKNVIRMLTAVVVTFFVCWFPFHAQRLFYVYGTKTKFYAIINEWAFYLTGVLYYMSATLNPILYNVMSVKYRTAFKQTLGCCFNSQGRTRGQSPTMNDVENPNQENVLLTGATRRTRRALRNQRTVRFNIENDGSSVQAIKPNIKESEIDKVIQERGEKKRMTRSSKFDNNGVISN